MHNYNINSSRLVTLLDKKTKGILTIVYREDHEIPIVLFNNQRVRDI